MGQVWQSDQRAVWKASDEVAEALSSSRCASTLGQELMAVLNRLVDCDFGWILSASPGQEWLLGGQKANNELIRKNHWLYICELEPAELQQLSTTFSRDRDAIPLVRRQHLSLYVDFLAPSRQSCFVARYWFMDGRVWSIGMSRALVGFSERDVGSLEALFPPVKAALRASTWQRECDEDRADNPAAAGWPLTPAEQSVAALITRGLTNKEIAGLLKLSPNTVRNTVSQIFEKVGASRRSEIGFLLRGGGSKPVSRTSCCRLDRQLRAVHIIQAAQTSISCGEPLHCAR